MASKEIHLKYRSSTGPIPITLEGRIARLRVRESEANGLGMQECAKKARERRIQLEKQLINDSKDKK